MMENTARVELAAAIFEVFAHDHPLASIFCVERRTVRFVTPMCLAMVLSSWSLTTKLRSFTAHIRLPIINLNSDMCVSALPMI
jgi:hypothetical protein